MEKRIRLSKRISPSDQERIRTLLFMDKPSEHRGGKVRNLRSSPASPFCPASTASAEAASFEVALARLSSAVRMSARSSKVFERFPRVRFAARSAGVAINRFPERLTMSTSKAGATDVNYEEQEVREHLMALTGGGPDACMDAVGTEAHMPGALRRICRQAPPPLKW